MKIDRIKENATPNPRKSIQKQGFHIIRVYGDSPNSRGRRERESWDGVLVVPGLPIVIDPTAAVVLSGLRGCPKYLTS